MKAIEIIFWVFIIIVFYTYIGYAIVLFVLTRIKRLFYPETNKYSTDYEPEVTLFVAAYNEKDFVDSKVKNTNELIYPKEKVKQIWLTDGSNDGTPEMLRKYEGIEVYHENERKGKIAAMNRGIAFVKTPIVIFSDGNTMLGKDSIREIVRLFSNPKVGCVSGEKRILSKEEDAAAGSGEGIYWKYESLLKKWDGELYSVVGAAGELFAVRTELFEKVEHDTLLDDFIVSMRIAMKGYTIQYSPNAYAIETASANVKEEIKRKIRIAAGGIQSCLRLKSLLNPYKFGILTFQYISHRVFRWTLAPLGLLLVFVANVLLVIKNGFQELGLYEIIFILQLLFYFSAFAGWMLENKKMKIKVLFVPYYFFIMNLCIFLGFYRYCSGKQTVKWERAKRGMN